MVLPVSQWASRALIVVSTARLLSLRLATSFVVAKNPPDRREALASWAAWDHTLWASPGNA